MANAVQKIVIHADDKTANAIGSAIRNAKRLDNQMQQTTKSMRGMTRQSRAHFGQLGHQVQDVAVQLQMGMNPLMVFGQQGSQVASIFGAKGALVGGLIAVSAVLVQQLAPAFFKASKDAKALKDELMELTDDLDEMSRAELSVVGEGLTQELDQQRAEIVKIESALRQEHKIRDELNSVIATGKGNILSESEAVAKAEKKIKELNVQLLIAQRREAALVERTEELTQAFDNLGKKDVPFVEIPTAVLLGYGQYASALDLIGSKETLLSEQQKAAAEDQKKRADQLVAAANEEAAQRLKALRMLEQARTPYERYIDSMREFKVVADAANLTEEQRLKVTKMLRDQYESTRKVTEASTPTTEAATSALKDYATAAVDVNDQLENVAMSGITQMEEALTGLVSGTMSAKDAFRSMAQSIVQDLIRMQIQQNITGPLAGALNSFLGGLGGPSIGNANQIAAETAMGRRANGGPVTGGRPYLVGERGPELMIPNGSGRVVSNEDMGSGSGVVVNQTINVSTGVQQTVRNEIATLMPQIANASKQAVLDARRRGGSFATAFGG